MKPKLQPIAFPIESVPFGEQAFQPLVLPDQAYVVTGGPKGLCLIDMHNPPTLVLTMAARDRISGVAVQGSHLYVQDGPVLSRWNLVDRKCSAAINVLQPSQRYSGAGEIDWAALHKLPDAVRVKQEALRRARRRAEWASFLEAAEQVRAAWAGQPDRAAQLAPLDRVVADVRGFLGTGGVAAVRSELTAAITDAAALVISPPVVRAHGIWGRAAAMVFVLGRDATLHPLDEALAHMGTRRAERAAVPALALSEFATDADSDEWACRLYYVTEAGVVQALDGGALPPAPLPSWPAKGAADLSSVMRPRVQDGLVWGGGAQGTGVYALTVDQPTQASRLTLPAGDWRWLEVRPEVSLALVATPTQTRLLSYGKGVKTVDRWSRRAPVAPGFSTFLPQSTAPAPAGRPHLVLEVDRESPGADPSVPFRVMVANSVDATDAYCAAWYPPPPADLFAGTLERWGTSGDLAPRSVRTQPSVSRQDVYLVARTLTVAEQFSSLLGATGPDGWAAQSDAVKQRLAQAGTSLGDIDMPRLAGRDALFCYALGNSITSQQADAAWKTLDALRVQARPVRLRVVATHNEWVMASRWVTRGPWVAAQQTITLRFGDGTVRKVNSDAQGWMLLPPETAGQTVTADPVMDIRATSTTIRLDQNVDNQIDQHSSSH